MVWSRPRMFPLDRRMWHNSQIICNLDGSCFNYRSRIISTSSSTRVWGRSGEKFGKRFPSEEAAQSHRTEARIRTKAKSRKCRFARSPGRLEEAVDNALPEAHFCLLAADFRFVLHPPIIRLTIMCHPTIGAGCP